MGSSIGDRLSSVGFGGNTGGGALTASAPTTIDIAAVNDAPTISDITDKTTNEDVVSGPHSFTIGDVETAAGTLTVSGTSSASGTTSGLTTRPGIARCSRSPIRAANCTSTLATLAR